MATFGSGTRFNVVTVDVTGGGTQIAYTAPSNRFAFFMSGFFVSGATLSSAVIEDDTTGGLTGSINLDNSDNRFDPRNPFASDVFNFGTGGGDEAFRYDGRTIPPNFSLKFQLAGPSNIFRVTIIEWLA